MKLTKEQYNQIKDQIEFYKYSLNDSFIYISKLKHNHQRLMYSNNEEFLEIETSKENQIFNPYLPNNEYIPDGEPRIFNDRLFVYGSHDKFNGKWFCENDYVLYSAPLTDLSDWTYHGVILPKTIDQRNGNLYAPDCICGVDGRYYLYYSKADTSVISIAVSDTPYGPFEFYSDVIYPNGEVLGEKETEYFQFDPSVIVIGNDVYLYTGSGQYDKQHRVKQKMVGCICYQLESDMKTLKDNGNIILEGNATRSGKAFFEGASVRYIDGLFYLVYPVLDGSGMYVSVSKYPNKDFTLQGPIHSTSDIGLNGHTLDYPSFQKGNNHGGIALINGDYFIFDHRRTNNSSFSRQGICEKTYFKDGKFTHVETTSMGLNAKPLIGKGFYPSHIACNIIGDSYITEFDKHNSAVKIIDNSLIGFKYFNFNNLKQVALTFSGNCDVTIELRLNENSDTLAKKSVTLDGLNVVTFDELNLTNPKCPLFIKVYKEDGKDIYFNQLYFN